MSAIRITSCRLPESVPGGPDRPGWIHASVGGRDDVSIVVSSCDMEAATSACKAITEVLPDATRAIDIARCEQERAQIRAEKALAQQHEYAKRLDSVLTGRSRLFGEALVRVDQDGRAWLLDPHKKDAGFGMHYPSLSDLWRAWPELRPVRWDGGELIVSGGHPMPQEGAA